VAASPSSADTGQDTLTIARGVRTAVAEKKPQVKRLCTTPHRLLIDMSTRRQIRTSTCRISSLDTPGDWRT
jgi:hypothetical protein